MKAPERFYGNRVKLARLFRGHTQVELGELAGVSHAFISQLESELKQPSANNLEVIAAALGFRPAFFHQPLTTEFRDDEVNFRRRATTPIGVRNRVLACGSLFGELVVLLDRMVSFPKYDVPTFRVKSAEDIERAAEACRTHWGLGLDLPIKNVARVFERAGIIITRFSADAVKIDAFSRAGERGVMLLNTDKGSASRTRQDMAHEAGHLVMHVGMETGNPEREGEADRFASAFLMPRAGFLREFPRPSGARLRLETLIPMKLRWRSSIAAIVRRAFDLQAITPAQYQMAFRQIYARGWHKGEPPETEPQDEPPEAVRLAFEVLHAHQKQTPFDLVAPLGWTPPVLRQVVPDALAAFPEPPESTENIISLDLFRAANRHRNRPG